MNKAKSFNIPKKLVWKAYKLVKANGGAAGVDEESLLRFEENLSSNLYKIWNRMSSGSYIPPPVMAVEIPKKSGGIRILGIPTVSDRIAQAVVKLRLEPVLEPHFHEDSYGYRPGKSAHQAIDVTRKRCWKHDWVLEFDIRALFDNIDHELLMKAVRKHTDCKWTILYIQRWLTAPMQMKNGELVKRDKGTPQGGVISPLLSNLFLHYAFDRWMAVQFPEVPFCRYADDGLVHCRTLEQAELMRKSIGQRFKECGLELHPVKTKVVYCKDGKRRKEYALIQFDFLGYTFKPRRAMNRFGILFENFSPAMSKTAIKAVCQTVRQWKLQFQNNKSIEELGKKLGAQIRGWINYYGKFYPSHLNRIADHIDLALNKWAQRKYQKLKGSIRKSRKWITKVAKTHPNLFPHWRYSSMRTTG
jgi:RNA-directed DNA polymerase